MFNEELHRRLDAETEREIHVSVLESVCQSIHALCEERHWEEQEGLRRVIGAGLQALRSQAAPIQPVGDMPAEKRMQFLQDRWSEVDGAYSTLQFLAYQVMNQNDALEMNMRGLTPRLQAATQRVSDLEGEVRRLRQLVPPEEQRSDVLVLDDHSSSRDEEPSALDRIHGLFNHGS